MTIDMPVGQLDEREPGVCRARVSSDQHRAGQPGAVVGQCRRELDVLSADERVHPSHVRHDRPGKRARVVHTSATDEGTATMSSYTKANLKHEVEDAAPKFGLSPGLEFRYGRRALDCEQSGTS